MPKFEVFSDRLEITSAGSIQPGEEQDDFFAGYSMPRNKALMRVFKDLEMVEYLGSGLPRILNAYSRDAYTFSSRFIRITLFISSKARTLEQKQPAARQNFEESNTKKRTTGKTTGKNTTGKRVKGKNSEQAILVLCRKKPFITIPEMAKALNMTEDGINYHLGKLRKQNRISRIGGRKFGQWQVNEKDKN